MAALRLSLLRTDNAARQGSFSSLKLGTWFIAGSAILSVLGATAVGAGDVADLVALRLLAYAAWAYGLLGLPALMKPELAAQSGAALARLRGLSLTGQSYRRLGLTLRLTRGLLLAALPGVIVAAVTSETLSSLLSRVLLVLLSAIYLVILGVTLGALGTACERLVPSHPRSTALTVALGPFVLSLVVPGVPSLPGAFLWLFDGLTRLGGFTA